MPKYLVEFFKGHKSDVGNPAPIIISAEQFDVTNDPETGAEASFFDSEDRTIAWFANVRVVRLVTNTEAKEIESAWNVQKA